MKYDGTNFEEVIAEHEKYLNSKNNLFSIHKRLLGDDKCTQDEGSIADFSDTNLIGKSFVNLDLQMATFSEANLASAQFINCNLSHAWFNETNLFKTFFSKVNLIGSNFGHANLIEATFDLSDLSCSNFNYARLDKVDFERSYLYQIDGFQTAYDVPYIPMACPDTGAFIGWKKAIVDGSLCIVKLLIPEDAKRSSAVGRKCRCDKAIVLEIQDCYDGHIIDPDFKIISSLFDKNYKYKVGDTIVPNSMPFDENRWDECSYGIHFFINRQEAINYDF